MRIRPSSIALILILVAAPSERVLMAQQHPGEPVTRSNVSLRKEFLAVTYKEAEAALADWLRAIDRQDTAAVRKLLAEQVRFSPAQGWVAVDPAEVVDRMADWLPTVSGYGFSIVDFDASASLAYLFGSVHYQRRGGGQEGVVVADATLVLARRGSRWLVRSYLERPRR